MPSERPDLTATSSTSLQAPDAPAADEEPSAQPEVMPSLEDLLREAELKAA